MAAVNPTTIRRLTEQCGLPCVEAATVEALHRDCFCLAVDPQEVREHLNEIMANSGSPVRLGVDHEHLFSSLPIFVPEATLGDMARVVRAITEVASTSAYVTAVLSWAPAIALHDTGSPGGMLGFDFHLSPEGPRLIEINTNPGGLLLNAKLAQAQRLCMPDLTVPEGFADAEAGAISAILTEWKLQGMEDPDALIAIVDEEPEQQYLYAEFVLFKRLLQELGHRTAICDPGELHYEGGRLWLGGDRVGLVYNRLTDFSLGDSRHEPLRQAYLDRAVALSPHPRAHAIFADKRNLSLLCQRDFLENTGVPADQMDLIASVVPMTQLVTPGNRDILWQQRRHLFFKPASGFGSKASYRGDKLTLKTWQKMKEMVYVAQEVVPPSERHAARGTEPLKVDIRCYAYQGEALFFAARLYQGQTTNFRTPGGGFAPVLTLVA